MKTKNLVLGVIVALIIIVIILIQNPFSGDEAPVINQPTLTGENVGKDIGQKAINIAFRTFSGEQIALADFRGKSAVVVNAWAGWCPFCIDEIPDLQEASDKIGDDVEVVFVHRTSTEPQSTGQRFLDNFPTTRGVTVTDPVVTDPSDNFYKTYFGFGMPVTVFIDKDGIVRDRKVGSLTVGEIEEKMEALR